MKRIAAIHDISGFGKCSLTVVLPIISAAGVECAVVPTAVLSTHTGGFEGFTYRDLTSDLEDFYKHWASLGLNFDALYSGFLGSADQVDIISNLFRALKKPGTKIIVDPVMADNGNLYSIFDKQMVAGMSKLCSMADVIIPNITEASFIAETEYKHGPYSEEYVEDLIQKVINKVGNRDIVLTGVWIDAEHLGAAAYTAGDRKVRYVMEDYIEGYFHGTGDIFGSVLVAGLMRDMSLTDSAKLAASFTVACIRASKAAGTPPREGVPFEGELYRLMRV